MYTIEKDFSNMPMCCNIITAEGRNWDINYSPILTKLIQECGRLCERFASDLFITWNSINEKLKNKTMETSSYLFGIRENGVDNNELVLARYNSCGDSARYEYRKIYRLDVEIKEYGEIIMELYDIMKP